MNTFMPAYFKNITHSQSFSLSQYIPAELSVNLARRETILSRYNTGDMLSSCSFRLIIGAILVLHHHDALAQIPAVCVSDEILQLRECCPIVNGMQCGGPNQGECKNVTSACKTNHESNGVLPAYADLRFNWPMGFFDRVCMCINNFGDFDCGRCEFGYTLEGGSCIKSDNRIRKSVSSMNDDEWSTYNMQLNNAKTMNSRYKVIKNGSDHTMASNYQDVSLYNLVVWMHHYAARTDNGMLTDDSAYNYAHGSTAFLTWHRLYLLWFEREMQIMTGDPNFALSYWNWLDKSEREVLFNGAKLGSHDSNGNVVSDIYGADNWKPVCLYDRTRVPNKFHSTCNLQTHAEDSDVPRGLVRCKNEAQCSNEFSKWPKEEDTVMAITSMNEFRVPNLPFNKNSLNSFSNYLEGWDPDEGKLCTPEHESVFCGLPGGSKDGIPRRLHNTVHILLGGTMLNVAGSANDPLFFNHHTMIDCLFERWMEEHSDVTSYPNSPVAPRFAGHGHGDCLVPFIPLYNNSYMFKRSNEFGYTCDLLLSNPVITTQTPTTTPTTHVNQVTTGSAAAENTLSASIVAVSVMLVCLVTLYI